MRLFFLPISALMSQDCKEWIKTRMAVLKKQAGFNFNQDLFISILLCLISGRDKHLILTAPPDRLTEVTQMASQVIKCRITSEILLVLMFFFYTCRLTVVYLGSQQLK
jgi:hypothetical protein